MEFFFQLLYLPHNYGMDRFRDIIPYAKSPYYSLNNLVCLYFMGEKSKNYITFYSAFIPPPFPFAYLLHYHA